MQNHQIWRVSVAAATILGATFAVGQVRAQSEPLLHLRHASYLEVGGATTAYSVNYEYQPIRNWALRFGGFATPTGYRSAKMGGVILGGSHLLGRFRHRLELGAAATAAFIKDDVTAGYFPDSLQPTDGFGLSISPVIGYRFEPQSGGLMLRLGLTPVIPLAGAKLSQSPLKGGLSVGWRF